MSILDFSTTPINKKHSTKLNCYYYETVTTIWKTIQINNNNTSSICAEYILTIRRL